MAAYGYAIRSHMATKFSGDNNDDGFSTRGLFSKADAHHLDHPRKHAVAGAESPAYRPNKPARSFTREYLFGSKGDESDTPRRAHEPTLITSDGWTRPTRAGWALPPEVPLGKALRDAEEAAAAERRLGGSPKPLSAATGVEFGDDHRWGLTYNSPKRSPKPLPAATGVEFGDDRRLGSTYNSPKHSPRPLSAATGVEFGDDRQWGSTYKSPKHVEFVDDRRAPTYTPKQGGRRESRGNGVIDSNEAARKYGGRFQW